MILTLTGGAHTADHGSGGLSHLPLEREHLGLILCLESYRPQSIVTVQCDDDDDDDLTCFAYTSRNYMQ